MRETDSLLSNGAGSPPRSPPRSSSSDSSSFSSTPSSSPVPRLNALRSAARAVSDAFHGRKPQPFSSFADGALRASSLRAKMRLVPWLASVLLIVQSFLEPPVGSMYPPATGFSGLHLLNDLQLWGCLCLVWLSVIAFFDLLVVNTYRAYKHAVANQISILLCMYLTEL